MANNIVKNVNCSKCTKVVYENSNCICCDDCQNWFHLRCTNLNLKEFNKFTKDSSLTFCCDFCTNYKCGKCNKPVFDNQNAIYCNSCFLWYHVRCSKLSLIHYHELSRSSESWTCTNCFTFPFHNINDNEILENFDNTFDRLDTFSNQIFETSQQKDFSTTCSVCSKRTIKPQKIKKLIPCPTCHSLIHPKCSKIPLCDLISIKRNQFKYWECIKCCTDKFPFADIDNSEIQHLNFNSNFNCQCAKDALRNNDFNFKRFQYSQLTQENDNDIFGPDPDNTSDKIFDFHPNFDYYDIHDFHKLNNKTATKKKNSFSIFHSNIQSLMHNFDELDTLLDNLGTQAFDIVALSETWNPENKLTFRPGILKGYHVYKGTQGKTIKGGCGLYIRQDLKFIDRNDLNISFFDENNEFQCKWIEIINKNSVNILIGVYYRHPKKNSDNTFNTKLKETLQTLSKENKMIVITGDFNYDLLNLDKNAYSKDFIDILYSNFYQPCIVEPTRCVKGNRPTLIDNIFINTIEKDVISGNLIAKISDHMPNFMVLNDFVPKLPKIKRQMRDFVNFDKNAFNEDVNKIQLPSIDFTDTNVIYNHFHDEFLRIVEKHAPMKILSNKETKWLLKPWITKGIQKSIGKKDVLYKKYLKSKSTFWHKRYILYRNRIKQLIFFAKKKYYTSYFDRFEKNSKKVWAGINSIIHKSTKNNIDDIFINENGNVITDQKVVSNSFNRFYTSIADKLVEKLGNPNNKFQDYLKNPNKHSIFLNEIEPDEVYNILLNLNPNKAADFYGISPKFLKIAANYLYKNLTNIYNHSFTTGVFPDKMKIAKVVPVFKSGSRMEVKNYRPISLLPIFSKIFEKLMHSRIYKFLQSNKIIFKNQYGFQKNKSTEHAILDIQSKIVDAYENKEIPCCIFLDFAKAFDTVNHNILLNKLNHYGIRGNCLKWLHSYLTTRNQCVQIGNKLSSALPITCGVPQGSVLGPLLFLVYINDIANSSDKIQFQLFADDTCIFYSHRDKTILENTLNNELNHVSNWLIANKLSLNVDKSNVLTFRNKNSNDDQILNLSINGEQLKEKIFAKYLGVFFYHKLTWDYQIEHITTKLVKGNALLAKLRHFVPEKTMLGVYNALIQPHLDYGILSWSSSAQSHLSKIEKLQNKSVRIISFKKREDLPSPLYKFHSILPLKFTIILNQGKFIWKLLHNQLPFSITEIFENHGVTLTDRDLDKQFLKLKIPFQRTNYGLNFIIYSGVKTWNQVIPNNITIINSIIKFKKDLKKHLLELV